MTGDLLLPQDKLSRQVCDPIPHDILNLSLATYRNNRALMMSKNQRAKNKKPRDWGPSSGNNKNERAKLYLPKSHR